MRLFELLESYTGELQIDLKDLLISAKARGIDDIETDLIVQQLTNMGYSVSAESLLSMLEKEPMVNSADTSKISLTDVSPVVAGSKNDSEQKVIDLAQKAAKKGIKNVGL